MVYKRLGSVLAETWSKRMELGENNVKGGEGRPASGGRRGQAWRGAGSLPRRLLTGWILAFCLTGGYWGMALRPVNRWAMYFTHLDFWALLAVTLAGGSVLGAGAFTAERLCPRSKPLLAASFWGWLALALANNFPSIHETLAARTGWGWLEGKAWWLAVWTAGGAGTLCALCLTGWRNGAARGWRALRLLLWPIVLFVPFSVWRLPSLDAARGRGLDFSRVEGNGEPAVVVVMFDMLGYEELFDGGGEVREAYTNFARFCRSADVYHAAESAGTATGASLPGFIVQERLEKPPRRFGMDIGDWYCEDAEGRHSARERAGGALPVLARERGGRDQAIGMYVPWEELLPGTWSATESMALLYGNQGCHVFGGRGTFWTAAREHLARHLLYVSKTPLAALFRVSGLADRTEAQGYEERTSLVARAERLLREALSPGDFFFIHCDMPHDPYAVGPGGEPLPVPLYWRREGLAPQTEGTDWVLGVWLEAIASTPAGREAWVIVTSDHNVHDRWGRRGPRTHVPFLVHRPGQAERRDIARRADLTDLRHVLPDLPLFGGADGGK